MGKSREKVVREYSVTGSMGRRRTTPVWAPSHSPNLMKNRAEKGKFQNFPFLFIHVLSTVHLRTVGLYGHFHQLATAYRVLNLPEIRHFKPPVKDPVFGGYKKKGFAVFFECPPCAFYFFWCSGLASRSLTGGSLQVLALISPSP